MNKFQTLLNLSFFLILASCANEPKQTATSASSSDAATYKPTVKTSLGIMIGQASAAQGTETCLDVKVRDFEEIVSIQHSINWDTEVLKFNRVQSINLEGASEASFGLTYTEKGAIGFSWYDPKVQGISLAENTVIYQVCFDAIGAAGSSSLIRISGDPVEVEVSNSAERMLGIPTGKGKITIQ